jgi:enoyl-CoA hydratase/carnithine racemase
MSSAHGRQLWIDRSRPEVWTVIISNPPINMLDRRTIGELHDLLPELELDETLKAIIFQSADPDYFIAHYDSSGSVGIGMTGLAPYQQWQDFVLRFSKAPVVTIAKIAGRARGLGNEFLLACDLRFASKEKAIFGQPEVGLGVVPGGGALEWLPRLVGRSRALEIVLGADDFDAETAELYGMINRAVDDAKLDACVECFASRIATFDKQALRSAKELINRTGVPAGEEIYVSNRTFFQSEASPGAQARRAKMRGLGFAQRTEFELHLGKAIKSLG